MRGKTLLTFVLLLLAGVFAARISSGVATFAPRVAVVTVAGNVQRLFLGIGSGFRNTLQSVSQLRRLRDDYQRLLIEIERYQRVADAVELLEAENQRLREQLLFQQRTPYRSVGARIIAREPTAAFSGLTIDRGSRHGVRAGQAVVGYVDGREGLVGRVLHAGTNVAVVLPVFDGNSYLSARLSGSRHEGLIEGQGTAFANLTMRHVDPRARNLITYGDLVLTSGLSEEIPGDIRIGYVRRVSAPPYEPALELEIEPAIEFSRLEYVFVLTAPTE